MRGVSNKTRVGDWDRGQLAEMLCLRSLDIYTTIGTGRLSTRNEDIYGHWDFVHEGIKYDVKASNDSGYNWIELVNVNGYKGSLYGNADVIAIEDVEDFILIDRKKLVSFIESVVIKEFRNKEPYYLYQRKGRKDQVVLIPTDELRRIGTRLTKLVSLLPHVLNTTGSRAAEVVREDV